MTNRSNDNVPGERMGSRLREQVSLEVVSSEARLRLTRLLRQSAGRSRGENAHQIELIRVNKMVNLAHAVVGRLIYTLELSDWDYEPAEYAWHNGELEMILRRPDTEQLVEILADLIENGALIADQVNQVLKAAAFGIRYQIDDDDSVVVSILDLEDLPEEPLAPGEHANVRKLVDRMDRGMQDKDWTLVLHTAASIFETVAKSVVPNSGVQNQSLGGWFSLYRKHSQLSAPLLDAIEEVFKRRNIEPMAGHGSTSDPSINEEDAIQVRELTIALIRLERTLAGTATRNAAPARKRKPVKA